MMIAIGAALIAYVVWCLRKPALTLKIPNGQRYLTRWHFLSTRFASIYLHRIDALDPDRHLHNHPWRAAVFVLRKPGAYTQEVLREGIKYYDWPVGRINLLGEWYHRIIAIAPGTWTLCVCGPRRKEDWGFWVDGKHVQWETYVATVQKGVLHAEGTVSGKVVAS